MSEIPDLTVYHLVHRAMRETASQFARALTELTYADVRRASALEWWWTGFAAELHNHHTIEDEIFFPALALKVPAFAAYEAGLAADHARLDEMMSGLTTATAQLAAGGVWNQPYASAVELSAELARFLDDHLTVEDEDVLPLFVRHFTASEYAELDERAMKHAPMQQMLFNVPWALSAVGHEERRELLTVLPTPIRVIWRLTRRRYERRAELAFGVNNREVAR
jgi:hypothetical protein